MDKQKTLAWLEQLSAQALQEARQGNPALVNKIGQNKAVAYYFNNVHVLHSMPAEQFAAMGGMIEECDALRVQYEQIDQMAEQNDRMSRLEAGLAALQQQIAQMLEAQKPVAKKGAKKLVEDQPADVEEPEAEIPPVPDQPEGDTDETPAEGTQDDQPEGA